MLLWLEDFITVPNGHDSMKRRLSRWNGASQVLGHTNRTGHIDRVT